MIGSGYAIFDDPYCYKGTFVLKNKAGLRDQHRLEAFEIEMTTLRSEEAHPTGRFGTAHYRSVHKHLFRDVYNWAGRYRTVRTSKGGNAFCYPEHIVAEMEKLFGRLKSPPFTESGSASAFTAAAASFLAELNAVHPFREGNGRAQLTFLHAVSIRAGRQIDFGRIRPAPFLAAMIESFGGALGSLERELRHMQ